MAEFYALRYLPEVMLKDRKHQQTLGRFETFADADDARVARPASDLLEVVQREDEQRGEG